MSPAQLAFHTPEILRRIREVEAPKDGEKWGRTLGYLFLMDRRLSAARARESAERRQAFRCR